MAKRVLFLALVVGVALLPTCDSGNGNNGGSTDTTDTFDDVPSDTVGDLPSDVATDLPGTSSPSKLVYTSDKDGDPNLYIANVDGTGEAQLTFDALAQFEPEISPDGTRIAFTVIDSTTFNIWLIDTDGTNLQQVTTDDQSASPDWRTDNELVHDNAGDLVRVDLNTGTVTVILSDPVVRNPSYCPFNDKVVFQTPTAPDGTPNFSLSNIAWCDASDGGNLEYLTDAASSEFYESPRCSPGGTWVLCSVFGTTPPELVLIDLLDSNSVTVITDEPDPIVGPDWCSTDSGAEILAIRFGIGSNIVRFDCAGTFLGAITTGEDFYETMACGGGDFGSEPCRDGTDTSTDEPFTDTPTDTFTDVSDVASD